MSAVDNPGQRMEEARRPVPKPRSRNRRRWAQVLLAVVAAGTAVLALIFLPYHTTSRELTIPPRGSASTQLSAPPARLGDGSLQPLGNLAIAVLD